MIFGAMIAFCSRVARLALLEPKTRNWLFWEAVGYKIFIWLFGYFFALLQLFHSTNVSWRRVTRGACSLSLPP